MGLSDLWICPYNPAHVMQNNHRIQIHLAKCSKNYPDKKLTTCLFNATHMVPEQDREAHMRNCPDNKIMLRDMIEEKNEFIPESSVEPLPESSFNVNHSTEVWEARNPGRAWYDPHREMKHKPIMRKPMPCAGKATQRDFRLKDIERLERLEKNLPPEEEESATNPPNVSKKTPSSNSLIRNTMLKKEERVGSSNEGHMVPLQYQAYGCLRKGVVGELEPDTQSETDTRRGRGRAAMLTRRSSDGKRSPSSFGHGGGGPSWSECKPPSPAGRSVGRLVCDGQFGSISSSCLNDFDSRDPKKLQLKYLEKLSKIEAIKNRKMQGISVTVDEQRILDEEAFIRELLEKLNIGG